MTALTNGLRNTLTLFTKKWRKVTDQPFGFADATLDTRAVGYNADDGLGTNHSSLLAPSWSDLP